MGAQDCCCGGLPVGPELVQYDCDASLLAFDHVPVKGTVLIKPGAALVRVVPSQIATIQVVDASFQPTTMKFMLFLNSQFAHWQAMPHLLSTRRAGSVLVCFCVGGWG